MTRLRRSIAAAVVLGVFLLLPSSARAGSGRCGALDVRGELTCSSAIHDEVTHSTSNQLTGPYACPQRLPQAGGEHVYSFVCQKDGRVHLLVDELLCDLDIYVLEDSCDTVRGCLGESVAASNVQDEVSFQCRAGRTYYIAVEGYGFQYNARGLFGGGGCSDGRGTYRLRFDVSDETGGCAENCQDGRDNDRDGLTDCDDPDCHGDSDCEVVIGEVGFDLRGLPNLCFEDMNCSGVVELQAPAAAGAALLLDSTLSEPGAVIWLDDGGDRVPLQSIGGRRFEVSRRYSTADEREWSVVVELPGRGTFRSPLHALRVATPLKLLTPAELDFGTVGAGTATLLDDHCLELDLSASRGLEEQLFNLELDLPSADCLASPVLVSSGRRRDRLLRLPLVGYVLSPRERLCLEVPACAGEVAPDGVALRIVPNAAMWADQEARVDLRWQVEGRSWLSCNAWWLTIVGSVLFMVWIVVGFIRPARLPAEVAVCIAGSQRGLRRTAAIPLRECRGSSAGFYRDASVGIHSDGSVNGRVRGALVRLRACRDRSLVLRGNIEMLDRRKRRWVEPNDLASGHLPSPSTAYRAGGVYFRFEGL